MTKEGGGLIMTHHHTLITIAPNDKLLTRVVLDDQSPVTVVPNDQSLMKSP